MDRVDRRLKYGQSLVVKSPCTVTYLGTTKKGARIVVETTGKVEAAPRREEKAS